ncbi:activating signal cointegrator 1 complex subunit 1 [Carcharodon carcharias]|uniref:activating signal cointegrator 1 complex subunit 1 n=1 Tax=Carcharodon carcharias TaxID=13397 RepID=UPI001B7DF3E0|nr:activating signal cointegrator 1 complex subunit 1 [Carcharodon carcharias]XP_041032322.1 activating signal cointegrator 1 complex subunit 1 [Carcharodon carcharias]XP_041032323.1 activating signal cointegrator 1 complex subunit 1 [Carcharodon carcharias]
MEVLRPTLINIDGRIYRKNHVKEQVYSNLEEEDFTYSGVVECMDEPCDSVLIEQTERGYRCAMAVPSTLYKYVIGKKGETKRRLETETRTSITIPKPGMEGEIVITGQQRAGVASAQTRIEVMLESFRRKQPFTHFLSFAVNHSTIQEQFVKFKERVLDESSQDRGIDSSIFQNPAKLHLTIGTLVLLNEQEITKACELLQKCKEDFISKLTDGKPLIVRMEGIEYMNDDPSMVDVLYGKIQMKNGTDKLQLIADGLLDRFVASGLMEKEWDKVKLHATLMNTLFRRDPTVEGRTSATPGKQNLRERESFDARNVLKKCENYRFGDVELNAVHISQRFSTDSSGFYSSSGAINFS